jgi:hypothetical protein
VSFALDPQPLALDTSSHSRRVSLTASRCVPRCANKALSVGASSHWPRPARQTTPSRSSAEWRCYEKPANLRVCAVVAVVVSSKIMLIIYHNHYPEIPGPGFREGRGRAAPALRTVRERTQFLFQGQTFIDPRSIALFAAL